jgi:flagellar biogenesis protein FliO
VPLPLTLFAQAAFEYTPPTAPPAPDLFGVLLRLGGLTVLTLLLCGGVIWWARRATRKRLLAANSSGRLVLVGNLPLDARNAVHLIRVDGHPVVVTTDATGLKAILPVQPTFDAVLDDTADAPTPAGVVSVSPLPPI